MTGRGLQWKDAYIALLPCRRRMPCEKAPLPVRYPCPKALRKWNRITYSLSILYDRLDLRRRTITTIITMITTMTMIFLIDILSAHADGFILPRLHVWPLDAVLIDRKRVPQSENFHLHGVTRLEP